MSIGLSLTSYMVQRDRIDSGICSVSKVRMGVHWTVPYVLHGTKGRDRQWDLRGKQGTYGCPLDCPLRPTWYRGTG